MCARCGRMFEADSGPIMAAQHAGLDETPGVTVHAPAFPGKQVFRAVQRLVRRPSFILRTTRGRPQAVPTSGKSERRWLFGRLGLELRRMFFAALVFLGIPAALIFFVIVVLAPKEDVALRRPVRAERPQPAKTVRHPWLKKLLP